VGPGPAGTGLHRTRSGKLIDSYGNYVSDHYPRSRDAGKTLAAKTIKATRGVGRGADAPHTGPGSFWRLGVKERQRILKDSGYRVTVDGKPGPQTKAASKAYVDGVPAKYWNAHSKLADSSGGVTLDLTRNQKPGKSHPATLAEDQPRSRPPVSGGANSGTGVLNFGRGGVTPLDPSIANLGSPAETSTSDIAKYAEALAGQQYDAAIGDAQNALSKNPGQTAQNLRNIGDWYNQVLGALGTATTRDAEINKAATGSIGDATQAILASLGGSANEGSGLVGAAGAQAQGTLGALGATQEQYNSDLAPILQNESASARTREQARQSQAAQELTRQLMQLRQQKGQAQASTTFEQNQTSKDDSFKRAMDIAAYNNDVAQRAHDNRLADYGAAVGAQSLGFNQSVTLGEQARADDELRLRRWQATHPYIKPTMPQDWAHLTPGQRTSVQQQAFAQIAELDENGQPTGRLKPGIDTPTAVRTVANFYRNAGFSPRVNPGVRQSVFGAVGMAGVQPQRGWLPLIKQSKPSSKKR